MQTLDTGTVDLIEQWTERKQVPIVLLGATDQNAAPPLLEVKK